MGRRGGRTGDRLRRPAIDEFARAWVEQKTKPGKDRDDKRYALMDYEHDLAADDPDGFADIALSMLKIEMDPDLLGVAACISEAEDIRARFDAIFERAGKGA